MTSFLELKKQTENLMCNSKALASKLGFEGVAERIQESINQFREKELVVVVAGEARRGKSSLLNALLNSKDGIFPVDVNVCTNVVTILRYGEQARLEVCLEDGSTEMLPMEQSHIADYVSEQGNPNNYKNVRLLNVYLPMEALKNGVVFVDTPGVGSLNVAHAQMTYAFLPNADLLIFVGDADSGFTETELNFLKRGYQYCTNVVFPLTKKDLKADYAVIAEDNRKKIHHTLGIPEDQIQIIPVSSAAKLRYLERGSQSLYKNSNYPQLEKVIWDTITETRASVMILPYLNQVREHLLTIQDSIAAQLQMLQAENGKEKTEELISQLEEQIERQKNLQEEGAQWRSELIRSSTNLTYKVNPMIQAIQDSAEMCLRTSKDNLGDKICRAENYMRVLADINDQISTGMLGIRSYIEDEVGKTCNQIYESLDLNVNINESALDKINYKPAENISVAFPKRTLSAKIKSGGQKITSTSFAFGAVGGVLGGVAGLVLAGPGGAVAGSQLGSMLGSVLGSTKGCVDALQRYDETDVNAVINTLGKHICASVAGVRNGVSGSISDIRFTLSEVFEQQLKQQAKIIQENITQLQKNVKISAEDVPQKMAALRAQSKILQNNIQQIMSLENDIQDIKVTPERKILLSKPTEEQVEKQTPASYDFL